MPSVTVRQDINTWSYVQLVVTEQAVGSDEIVNNYSDVDWRLEVYRQYAWDTSASKSGWVKVDNVTVWSGSNTLGGSGTKILASGTRRVYHNSNGSKTDMPIAFFQQIQLSLSGVWCGDYSSSGTMDLTTIPRASLLTLNNNNFDIGDDISLSVTEFDSSFTYKWYHDFRDGFWSPFTPTYESEWDYYSYATPYEAWLDNLTTGVSGDGRIKLETWNAGQTSKIGETIIYFTALVPADVKPTCTLALTLNDIFNIYAIKGISSASLEIQNEAGIYGSTIASYHIEGQGLNVGAKSGTSTPFTVAGSTTYSAYVIDSRGRQSATVTQSFTVTNYYVPTIDFEFYRALSDGTRDDANGTYIYCSTTYDIATVTGNDVYLNELWIDGAMVDSEYPGFIVGLYGEYTLNEAHTIELRVQDDVSQALTNFLSVRTQEVKIGTVPFNIGVNKDRVAVGKYAEHANVFEVAPGWDLWTKGGPVVSFETANNSDVIKFYDGTMIQYTKKTVTYGSIAANANIDVSAQTGWTFNEAFLCTPVVTHTLSGAWSQALNIGLESITAAGVGTSYLYNHHNATISSVNLTVHYMAIGRWKL